MGALYDVAAAASTMAKKAAYRVKGRDWRGGTTLSAAETDELLRDRDWVCLEEDMYSTYVSHGDIMSRLYGDDEPRRDYVDGATAAVKIGAIPEADVNHRKLDMFDRDGVPLMELEVSFDRESDELFPTYDKGTYTVKAVLEDCDDPREYLAATLDTEHATERMNGEAAVTPEQIPEILRLAQEHHRPVRCETPMQVYFPGHGTLTDTVDAHTALQEYNFLRDQYTVLGPDPERLDPDELWRNRGEDDPAFPIVDANPWQDRYEIAFAVAGRDQDGNPVPASNVSLTLLPPDTGEETADTADHGTDTTVNQYLQEEGIPQ